MASLHPHPNPNSHPNPKPSPHPNPNPNPNPKQLALKDAEKCVSIDPNFAKGWSRKGSIHLELKEFDKAKDCYQVTPKVSADQT